MHSPEGEPQATEIGSPLPGSLDAGGVEPASETQATTIEGNESARATEVTPVPGAGDRDFTPLASRSTASAVRAGEVELTPGKVIAGHFHLVSRLGKPSTFGEVWRAHDSALDRAVAIKVLKRELCNTHLLSRFELERQIMARMAHSNIAVVYECGTTDGRRPYLVMELLGGETLTTYCDAQKLSTEARLRIFVAICRGVDYAHQIKVIHRDLKPGNIIVVDSEDGPTPKVIDFGIAKVIQGADFTAAGAQTMAYERVGTPYYMSPEQVSPKVGPIGAASDVYTLGVILYELLAGETPFRPSATVASRAERHETIFSAILSKNPDPPSARAASLGDRMSIVAANRHIEGRRLPSKLKGDLDAIVLHAIEKRPEDRYASAGELADDVARHLRGEAVQARPGKLYRLGRFMRQHKAASFVGALVICTAAISTGAYLTTDAALTRESIALHDTEEARIQEAEAKAVAVLERNTAVAAKEAAEIAREAAERARNVEVRARSEAEELINYMLYDLRDQLIPLGRSRLLESISVRAERYFEEQPADSDNETLERNRGAMYANRGLILLAQSRNSEAKDSFEKAVEIMEHRYTIQPDDPSRRIDLVRALDGRGLVELADGRDDGRGLAVARKTFQRQLELLGPEPADPAADPSLGLLRASTFQRLGDLEFRLSELAVSPSVAEASLGMAASLFAREQNILLGLGKARPADPSVRQALAVNREKSGKVALTLRQPQTALRLFDEAVEIWQSLSVTTPGDLFLLGRLVIARGKVGDALLSVDWPTGNPIAAERARRALPDLQDTVNSAADLARIDSLNFQQQRELAAAHQRLAHALCDLRRFDEALDHSVRDLTLNKALAAKFRDQPIQLRDFAASLIRHGQILLSRARPSDPLEARTDFTRARELLEGLGQTGPGDAETRRLSEAVRIALAGMEKAGAPVSNSPK